MTLKAVFFDLDGTLRLYKDPYQHIHRYLGLSERTQQFTDLFKRGEIDSDEWIRRDAALWRGLSRHYLIGLLRQIPYMPGAAEFVQALKTERVLTSAISTGLQMHADIVRSNLKLDYAMANKLIFEEGIATGGIHIRVHEADKASVVRRIMDDESLCPEECMAVGDGESDIGMFQTCRLGIAISPASERVRRVADITIEETHLGGVMPAVYRLIPEWQPGEQTS